MLSEVGKKSNDKRRELFEKLKEEGRLQRPAIKRKKPPKPDAVALPPKCYCEEKFGPLPESFRRCSDCPEVEKP